MSERLQKILAQAGYGSRRACEVLIAEGRVRIDGRLAHLGDQAGPESTVTLDGRRIRRAEELSYLALYKPRNVVSSVTDPEGRKTVSDLIPADTRLYPVGRLDWDSEGLVLLTNDGDLANVLTHPRYGHTKEYRVLLARRPSEEQLETWRRGVVLSDGYKSAPAKVRVESTSGKGAWIRTVMGEGRKRQIRETAALLGLPVVRIIRVRIGTLALGDLKPGQWRRLTSDEVGRLRVGGDDAAQGGTTTSNSMSRPGKNPSRRRSVNRKTGRATR